MGEQDPGNKGNKGNKGNRKRPQGWEQEQKGTRAFLICRKRNRGERPRSPPLGEQERPFLFLFPFYSFRNPPPWGGLFPISAIAQRERATAGRW